MSDVSMKVVVNGEVWPTGCYIDGWWGQYAGDRLVQIAVSQGWGEDADPLLARAIRHRLDRADRLHDADEPDHEVFTLICDWDDQMLDSCADHLNALIEGDDPMFSFGWHDGEFFLLHQSEWEEMP